MLRLSLSYLSCLSLCAEVSVRNRGRLQRIIRSAEKVSGCNLPSLQDLHASRTLRRAGKIVVGLFHFGHKLLETLPSGRRLRTIKDQNLHENSFFPPATRLINKACDPTDTDPPPSPSQTFCTPSCTYCSAVL